MRTLLILASLFLFGTQAARTASGSEKIIAQYAREFNKPELFELVTHQIILIFEKTQDPETGQSKHFWSCATGWYLMGIVDVLDFLPENHPDRDSLIEILNKVSSALVSVQDKKTSLWYQVLDMGGDTPLKIVSLKM